MSAQVLFARFLLKEKKMEMYVPAQKKNMLIMRWSAGGALCEKSSDAPATCPGFTFLMAGRIRGLKFVSQRCTPPAHVVAIINWITCQLKLGPYLEGRQVRHGVLEFR